MQHYRPTARRYASAVYAMAVCCVRLRVSKFLSKFELLKTTFVKIFFAVYYYLKGAI